MFSQHEEDNMSHNSSMGVTYKVGKGSIQGHTSNNCFTVCEGNTDGQRSISSGRDLISCKLVDIPIARGNGTTKNNKDQSKWRRLTGKETQWDNCGFVGQHEGDVFIHHYKQSCWLSYMD